MSSADVRAAVSQYFSSAKIQGLNKVFPAPPYWADGSDWELAPDITSGGSGAIGAVHLVEDSESRLALPVLTGMKRVEYLIGFMVFYQYVLPSNSLAPVDESAWTVTLDGILDGIKDLLRADPNCGMPAVVWQSAQEPGDIKIQRDLPRRLPGKVVSWNVVEFHVTEMITD